MCGGQRGLPVDLNAFKVIKTFFLRLRILNVFDAAVTDRGSGCIEKKTNTCTDHVPLKTIDSLRQYGFTQQNTDDEERDGKISNGNGSLGH